jgi:proline dehydrogenase
MFWRNGALPFIEARLVRDGRKVCYARHWHETFSIGLISSGRCKYLNRAKTETIGAGTDLASLIAQRGIDPRHYEFESLIGLGTDQIDALRRRGFPTREYAVSGEEYFLYVPNRIAEEPIRLFQALIDAAGADTSTIAF